jgi:hypothetical protein
MSAACFPSASFLRKADAATGRHSVARRLRRDDPDRLVADRRCRRRDVLSGHWGPRGASSASILTIAPRCTRSVTVGMVERSTFPRIAQSAAGHLYESPPRLLHNNHAPLPIDRSSRCVTPLSKKGKETPIVLPESGRLRGHCEPDLPGRICSRPKFEMGQCR